MAKRSEREEENAQGIQGRKKRLGRPRLDAPSPDFLSKRAEIIDAAARVFQERGYEAGTLKDVAEAVGVTAGNIYYYIKNKEELLYEIILRSIKIALSSIQQVINLDCDSGKRLQIIMENHVDMLIKEKYAFSVFFEQKEKLPPEYYRIIRDKEREYTQYFQDAVKAAIQDGYLAKIDPLLAYQAIIGMCNWVYKWHRPNQPIEAKPLIEQWFRMIHSGQAAENNTGVTGE